MKNGYFWAKTLLFRTFLADLADPTADLEISNQNEGRVYKKDFITHMQPGFFLLGLRE